MTGSLACVKFAYSLAWLLTIHLSLFLGGWMDAPVLWHAHCCPVIIKATHPCVATWVHAPPGHPAHAPTSSLGAGPASPPTTWPASPTTWPTSNSGPPATRPTGTPATRPTGPPATRPTGKPAHRPAAHRGEKPAGNAVGAPAIHPVTPPSHRQPARRPGIPPFPLHADPFLSTRSKLVPAITRVVLLITVLVPCAAAAVVRYNKPR